MPIRRVIWRDRHWPWTRRWSCSARTVPAVEFFQDFFTTAMRPNEILTEIRVPKFTGWRAHYEKFNRVAQAWSIVGVATTVRTEAGTIAEARVGLTNMAPVPLRAWGREE